jgi:hypothetical protein
VVAAGAATAAVVSAALASSAVVVTTATAAPRRVGTAASAATGVGAPSALVTARVVVPGVVVPAVAARIAAPRMLGVVALLARVDRDRRCGSHRSRASRGRGTGIRSGAVASRAIGGGVVWGGIGGCIGGRAAPHRRRQVLLARLDGRHGAEIEGRAVLFGDLLGEGVPDASDECGRADGARDCRCEDSCALHAKPPLVFAIQPHPPA